MLETGIAPKELVSARAREDDVHAGLVSAKAVRGVDHTGRIAISNQEIQEIAATRLSHILRRNTGIQNIPDNVFQAP